MTAEADAPVRDTSAYLDVLMTASTPISVTMSQKLGDTPPRTYRFTAPLNFQTLALNPTPSLGSATLSGTVIQSK